ncbi:MAG: hypothetical protein RR015_05500 [Bacteroidales bacterium]
MFNEKGRGHPAPLTVSTAEVLLLCSETIEKLNRDLAKGLLANGRRAMGKRLASD